MFLCFKYIEIHFMWLIESLAEMSGMNMDNSIREIIRDASNANLTQDEIKKLLGIDRRKLSARKFHLDHKSFLLLMIIIGIAASNLCTSPIAKDFFRYLEDEYCLIDHTLATLEISRPVTNCTMCQNLVTVPKLEHVSKDVFTRKYAYTGVPLVVTNATGNWTALKVFDFKFLRKLYNMSKAQRGNEVNEGCQFFPYLTNFKTLKEVFQMSDRRASLHEDQWYVGWSNCDPEVMNIIRKHYQKPEFIPDDSESSELDWIFVGGYGKGAQMHIDFVGRPSWQAQISGRKTWTLVPPPECENVCRTLTVTVNKGDILAVDTNQWYHATYIHPGEMSITLGSEYD